LMLSASRGLPGQGLDLLFGDLKREAFPGDLAGFVHEDGVRETDDAEGVGELATPVVADGVVNGDVLDEGFHRGFVVIGDTDGLEAAGLELAVELVEVRDALAADAAGGGPELYEEGAVGERRGLFGEFDGEFRELGADVVAGGAGVEANGGDAAE